MKTLKIIATALATTWFASAYAQNTGINTKNPRAVLHVDGSKDNNASGAPTGTQPANDFVVTSTGNVGIGTIAPTAKLVIDNGTAGAAIKIIDGTQFNGYVLTSDANGVGTWTLVPAFRPTILGTFPASVNTVHSNSGSGGYVASGVSITLPQGKWAVNAGMTFSNISTDGWEHCYLSSSPASTAQAGFTHLGPAGVSTCYAGLLLKAAKASPTDTNGTSFISGSSIIDVTAPGGITLYLVFQRWTSDVFQYATNNSENYFYAVPVQ
ncbi:hypothetical protein [Sphingobacterium spiritivorum]|uniref:hypothetical protein n=1 Tax=Sphingobacterium spiritivorum TaxID=258 RepID=UPI0019197955|nr:hypothetical protein [Sphingobacterium spiritivorum]QQT25013.1 hypothetical protein I6J02_14950 [Sphingobacterium spiritivorum]